MRQVLVTGGSGFLGQYLIHHLHQALPDVRILYFYNQHEPKTFPDTVIGHKVDLTDGAGVQDVVQKLGPFDVVVNCAAISQPAACESNPDLAKKLNVPSALIEALQEQQSKAGLEALLVHLSTDQVSAHCLLG